MQTPLRAGVWPGSITALVLSTALLACGGASKDGTEAKGDAPAKTEAPAKADEVKAEVKADETKVEDAKAGDAKAVADGGAVVPPADTAGGPAAASGAPPTTAGADETGGTGGGDETAGETGGAVDVEALLKEIKGKKTKDARAQAAVAEAEAAGADPAALAKALVARGQALFAEPDRAKPFFELANEKDPKSPAAAFELAKQAAVVGEIDEAKQWLTVVHERKGKKLLKQIDFDPMWEILKDDPDVRAMLK